MKNIKLFMIIGFIITNQIQASFDWSNHPNTQRAISCRRAIHNNMASEECKKTAQYFDACKNETTGLDNYHRAEIAAQYNLTSQECITMNAMSLDANAIHQTIPGDNSFSEPSAVIIQANNHQEIPLIKKLQCALSSFIFNPHSSFIEEIDPTKRELIASIKQAQKFDQIKLNRLPLPKL